MIRKACGVSTNNNGVPDLGLLTMREVADTLHVSKAHVCNLISGKVRGCLPLPAIHMGRRMLVRREALMGWIEAAERATVPHKTGEKKWPAAS
jgi:excisionase family DNA binding protein